MGKIIKCKVRLDRQLYPPTQLRHGDEAILALKVVKILDGDPFINSWGNIIAKGRSCAIRQSDEYTLIGKEVTHDKYGKQYEILYIGQPADLTSIKNQRKFLSKILTEKQTKNIFETLENPIKVIQEKDIELLTTVSGIGVPTANKILDAYEASIDYSVAYVELDKYGITKHLIDKLIEIYGSPDILIDKIKENIYMLADEIDGIGFIKCDELALNGGMDRHDPRRVEAYIKYFLSEQAYIGNSWVSTNTLMGAIIETLGDDINRAVIKDVLYKLHEKKILWWDEDKTIIGLFELYELEQKIFNEIKRISEGENHFPYEDWERVVNEIEEQQGWKYTDEQREGVKTVLDSQVCIVTGYGGTGKTTITNAMIKILKEYDICQCALSGRASQRMKELNGLESYTIHRALGFSPKYGWMYNKNNPMYADIIILDEASMVGGDLFLKLLEAIRTGSKLVIMGDHGQLSSIGACNVFFDLLKEGNIPIVELTRIHRQAQASAIISKSIEIRQQKQIFKRGFEGREILGELQDLELDITLDPSKMYEKVLQQFREKLNSLNNDISKLQVVVPMRVRGDVSAYQLNNGLQAIYNNTRAFDSNSSLIKSMGKDKEYEMFVGDKVINVKNDYNATDINGKITPIFNGNMGIITEINIDEGYLIVDFIGVGEIILRNVKNLELGYAITCHKLQGSSADTVISVLDYSAFMMLSAEWLYTAITRAEKYCVLVGESSAITHAIRTLETSVKQTFLPLFLKEGKS